MKKFSTIIFAVIMALSVLTVNAAGGSYNITQQDDAGNSYVQAVLNGTYELDNYTDPYHTELISEVGATLTIKVPLLNVSILDTNLNTDKQWYAEDNRVYYAGENGVTTDTGACKITNLNKTTFTDDYGTSVKYFKSGITITFKKPGSYTIEAFLARIPGETSMSYTDFYQSITVLKKGGIAESHTAIYTKSKVLVNGKSVSFEAYNIGGNNYFKLRDLAMALNGSKKQFEVIWSAEEGAIYMDPGQPYTPVGGELVAGNGKNKECIPSTSPLYYYIESAYGKNFYPIGAKAFNINGNNYFKLRDICSALNIGVTWDGATSTIGIDTSVPYTE